MKKELSEKEANKYAFLEGTPCRSILTGEYHVIEMINSNIVTDAKDNYQVLVSIRKMNREYPERRIVENIRTFFRFYRRVRNSKII